MPVLHRSLRCDNVVTTYEERLQERRRRHKATQQDDLDRVRDWIATDPSEQAERLRAVLRGSLVGLSERARAFAEWSRRFDHRHIMRRKVRRIERRTWARKGQGE